MPPVCKTGALRGASSILVYLNMDDLFALQLLHPELHFDILRQNFYFARHDMLLVDQLREALYTPERLIYEEIYNAHYNDLYNIASNELREDIQEHTKQLIREETYSTVYNKLYSFIFKTVISATFFGIIAFAEYQGCKREHLEIFEIFFYRIDF